MYLTKRNGYWYLQEKQKDKNGKWFNRTIACFGKTKPNFRIPFIYRGCAEDIISSLKDNCINLILTDPPYGLTDNKWDIAPDWKQISKEYNRVLTNNGQIAIFGTIPNILDIYHGFEELFDFRYDCVWYKGTKTAFGLTTNKTMRTHENIFIFKKKNCDVEETIFNLSNGQTPPIGKKGKPYIAKKGGDSSNYNLNDNNKQIITINKKGYRQPESVIFEGGIGGSGKEYLGFPTQKPERVMEFFIRGLTKPNDTILDPYLGSGTTAKVSMENARMCIGSEIDPVTFPIITKRLRQIMKHFNIGWQQENGFLKDHIKSMTEGWT